MQRPATKLLEEARQLPTAERVWLIDSLMGDEGAISDEDFTAWKKEAGETEPGYDEWFRKGIEEALADRSGDVPHEQAMRQFHQAIHRARKLKETA